MIIVNKIPRGVYAGEEIPGELQGVGWYDIGLSRNGKEPIEYIWRARINDPYSHPIMSAEIGARGTLRRSDRGKHEMIRLPRPNNKKPPIIGMFAEVLWERNK